MRKPTSRKFRPDMLSLEGRKLMTADLTIDVTTATDTQPAPYTTSSVVVDGSDYNDVIQVTNYQAGRSLTLHLEQWYNGVKFSSRDQTVSLAGLLPRLNIWLDGKGGDDSIANQTAAGIGVNGGTGNDFIDLGSFGGGGYADGGDGNDAIYGSPGADYILGGDGNDFIVAGGGNDTIYGGLGSDYIDGEGGNDTIDSFSYGTRPGDSDYILGGDGNDVITGSNGNDTIHGDAGNDHIDGAGGNDRIYGGDGNDTINGGDGNDAINGDAGDDVIYGGGGDDVIGGDDGNDKLFGGDGSDSLYGGNGNDLLDGGYGSVDFLQGDGGADTFVRHKVVFGSDDSDRFVDYNSAQGDTTDNVWHAF